MPEGQKTLDYPIQDPALLGLPFKAEILRELPTPGRTWISQDTGLLGTSSVQKDLPGMTKDLSICFHFQQS